MSTSLPPPTGDEYRDPVRITDRQALALLLLGAAAELAGAAACAAVAAWLFT